MSEDKWREGVVLFLDPDVAQMVGRVLREYISDMEGEMESQRVRRVSNMTVSTTNQEWAERELPVVAALRAVVKAIEGGDRDGHNRPRF